jgi:serine/threonine protein kinase
MALITDIQKEVASLQFSGEFKTLPEFFSWLRKAPLLYSPEKIQYNTVTKEFNGKTVTISELTDLASGTFGTIQLGYVEAPNFSGYAFLKHSKKHQSSLVNEGLLQSCAHIVLKGYGFVYGVPRVLHIVSTPETGVNLVLQRVPNSKLFAEYLKNNFRWNQPCAENDSIILQVIVQVATYMAILESELGMNHRDLKSTNVLMVAPVEAYSKRINNGPYYWTLQSTLQVSIIDFGFTCIGAGGKHVLSAGEYLPQTDFCPKEGRDLFLFFASLWSIPAFRQSVSKPLAQCFEIWLLDSEQKSWADWLKLSEENALTTIYLICSGASFTAPPCSPIRVLQTIQGIAPELVQIGLLRRPGTPVPEF